MTPLDLKGQPQVYRACLGHVHVCRDGYCQPRRSWRLWLRTWFRKV